MSDGLRTIVVTDEEARIIVSALRNDAGRLRRNAPQPWYVGSARSLAYAKAMGAAAKRTLLANSISKEDDAVLVACDALSETGGRS